MPRKKLLLDTVEAFALYCRHRVAEKLNVGESLQRISEELGVGVYTLRERAMRGKWEAKTGTLLPVLASTIPTATTEHKVIDEQRQKFLKAANKLLDEWEKGMIYLSERFKIATGERNHDRAADILRQMNSLALMLRRAQEISGHATCDSGAALAASQDGAPQMGYASPIRILLAREIRDPRIPQPRPEPKTIELRQENGAHSAQSES